MAKERQRLQETWMNPNSVGVEQLNTLLKTPMSREASGEDLLRRPEMTYELLTTLPAFAPALEDAEAAEQVEIQVKYDATFSASKMKLKNRCAMNIPSCQLSLIISKSKVFQTRWY